MKGVITMMMELKGRGFKLNSYRKCQRIFRPLHNVFADLLVDVSVVAAKSFTSSAR